MHVKLFLGTPKTKIGTLKVTVVMTEIYLLLHIYMKVFI